MKRERRNRTVKRLRLEPLESRFLLAALIGTPDDRQGQVLSSIGDFNGDGLDDVLATSPASRGESGAISVHFGNPEGVLSVDPQNNNRAANIRMSAITGAPIEGPSDASGGYDFNGDGLHDFVTTATFFNDPNGNRDNEFESSVRLFLGNDQGVIVAETPIFGPDRLAFAELVDMVRDFDGDGLADIVTTDLFSRRSHLIFGQTESITGFVSLGTSSSFPADGLQYAVLDDLPATGTIVQASVGDINGDGRDDIAIAAGTKMHLYLGQESRRPSVPIIVTGMPADVTHVASAGDLNGDGFSEILIGFQEDLNGDGSAHVVFGEAGQFDIFSVGSELSFESLISLNVTPVVAGSGFQFGSGGGSLGDIDGDGRESVAIAAATQAFQATSVATAAVDSIAIDTEISEVRRAIGAFDFNGDGLDDLFFADPDFESGSGRFRTVVGKIDLALGTINAQLVSTVGDELDNELQGTAVAESLIGGRGNDDLISDGGEDILRGGSGDDRVVVSLVDLTKANGGRGVDTLEITDTLASVTLGDLLLLGFQEFEVLDFAQQSSGNNAIELQRLPLLNLSETSNAIDLIVDAGSDTVNRSPDWTTEVRTGTGGDELVRVQNGLAIADVFPADGPYFTVADTVVNEGDNGLQQATVTIRLHNAEGAAASVAYSTLERDATTVSNDFVPVAPTRVSFAAGETEKQVTIDIVGDLNIENEIEIFGVELSDPVGAGIPLPVGYIRIVDNESRTTSGEISDQRRWEVTEASIFIDDDVTISSEGSLTVTADVEVIGGAPPNEDGDEIQFHLTVEPRSSLSAEDARFSFFSQVRIEDNATFSSIDSLWVDSQVFNTDAQANITGNVFSDAQPLIADGALILDAIQSNDFGNGGDPLGLGFLTGVPGADVTLGVHGDIDHYFLHSRSTQHGFGHYQFANLQIESGVEVFNQGNTQVVLDVDQTLTVGEGARVRVRNDFHSQAPSLNADLSTQRFLSQSQLVANGIHRVDGLYGKGGDGGIGGVGEDREAREDEDFAGSFITDIGGDGGNGGDGGYGGGFGGRGGTGGESERGTDGFHFPGTDGTQGLDGAGLGEHGKDANMGSVVGSFPLRIRGSDGADGGSGGYGGGVLSIYASAIDMQSNIPAFIVSGQSGGLGGAGHILGFSDDTQLPIIRQNSEGIDGEFGQGGVLVIGAPNYVPLNPETTLASSVPLDISGHGSVVGEPESIIFVTRGAEPAANQPPSVSLTDTIASVLDDIDTALPFKVASVVVSDDDSGVNTVELSGEDASLFQLNGTELQLRQNVVLDAEINPQLNVTVEVDDPTLSPSPNSTTSLTINVIPSEVELQQVSIDASEDLVGEGGVLRFLLTRIGNLENALPVGITLGGTATEGQDYEAVPRTVTIPANASSVSIDIQSIADQQSEAGGTVTVSLANDPGYVRTGFDVVVGTIRDEVPRSRVIAADPTIGRQTIPADGERSVVLFQAVTDTILSVMQVDADVGSSLVKLLDSDANVIASGIGGVEASLIEGMAYALVFTGGTVERQFDLASADADSLTTFTATNLVEPADVNGNGETTSIDALLVINLLGRLSINQNGSVQGAVSDAFYDVNQDEVISALDALVVINRLARTNLSVGEGELSTSRLPRPSSVLAKRDLRLIGMDGQPSSQETTNAPLSMQLAAGGLISQTDFVVADNESASFESTVDDVITEIAEGLVLLNDDRPL